MDEAENGVKKGLVRQAQAQTHDEKLVGFRKFQQLSKVILVIWKEFAGSGLGINNFGK